MSDDLNSDLLIKDLPAAKPKRATAKKAATKAAAAVAAPAAKKAAAKKAPAKKAAAKKAATKAAKAVKVEEAAPAPKPAPLPVVEEAAPIYPPAKEIESGATPLKPARKVATKKKAKAAVEETAELPIVTESVAAPKKVAAVAETPAIVEAVAAAAVPAPVGGVDEGTPLVAEAVTTAAAVAAERGEDRYQGRHPQHGGPRHQQHQNQHPEQRHGRPQGRYNEGGGNAPEGQPYQGGGQQTPAERRKSKFERWKERRERMRQERQARQGGGGGGSGAEGETGRGQDYERPPEKPLGPPEPAEGIIEMSPKGYGFLRQKERQFAQHPNDAFIAPEFIRKFGLREGMYVRGVQQKGQRGPQITEVAEVNGRAPEAMRDLPLFEELKAINPNKRIQLETSASRLTTRVIDMITPVGRGQRGLIVAPPRAGKTTLLQHVAEAVTENHPNMHLMILLVDERPEEVTEFKRVLPRAEIFASSNDQDVKSHTRIAAFAIERAKRLVECGEHVFMLMDSITRMARAFNNSKQGGATMSGGMGVGALEIPRRLFAAARNTRTAGSLTILATALVETGSRMDDLIFQEFKGTGNMELVLDRKIAEQFYYPAVNIFKSGTRREELLLQPFQLDKIHMLRRGLAGHKPIDAIQRVLQLLERYPSNAQMLVELPSSKV